MFFNDRSLSSWCWMCVFSCLPFSYFKNLTIFIFCLFLFLCLLVIVCECMSGCVCVCIFVFFLILTFLVLVCSYLGWTKRWKNFSSLCCWGQQVSLYMPGLLNEVWAHDIRTGIQACQENKICHPSKCWILETADWLWTQVIWTEHS